MDNLELQLKEIEKKITAVKEFIETTGIDLSGEYEVLEEKRIEIMKRISLDLSPWQKVQIARHKSRPTLMNI
jgi:acetyl-CoA carboxylase carboxyl transferase subunit alpha